MVVKYAACLQTYLCSYSEMTAITNLPAVAAVILRSAQGSEDYRYTEKPWPCLHRCSPHHSIPVQQEFYWCQPTSNYTDVQGPKAESFSTIHYNLAGKHLCESDTPQRMRFRENSFISAWVIMNPHILTTANGDVDHIKELLSALSYFCLHACILFNQSIKTDRDTCSC